MRQQLIRFLGRCIKGHRIVYFVVCAERDLLISAVNTAARRIHQMLYWIMTAGFQYVVETNQVTFDVDIRMIDRVPYACLRS